jgi:hypothetical protein
MTMPDDFDPSEIDVDEPPEPPEPPMYEEWEDVETWTKGSLRYPVPGGWDIEGHGKFHTTWTHEDGTELSRSWKRNPGQKDRFVFTIDGEQVHDVETGPSRSALRDATVWLLTFYDDHDVASVDELQTEMRKARNQSLDAFAGGGDRGE